MVLALAALYRRFGGMAWLHGAFYGIGAAVIAVIARSAARLVRTTLRGDLLLWVLFLISAGVTAWTESEIVWVFLLCGVVAASRTRAGLTAERAGALVPAGTWLAAAGVPAATVLATPATIFLYFASAGLFVFGSGLAIVPFLHGGVVQRYHWLTEREFIDAVAVALITPGPVVITVAFIGYLVAGLAGATAAALGVFAPVYLITILFAPRYQRLKENHRVRAFVEGVTAAATGAIAGAAFVLGRRALIDPSTIAIAVATLLLSLGVRRLPEPIVVLAAGVAGVIISARGA
jgi:chromate transporter